MSCYGVEQQSGGFNQGFGLFGVKDLSVNEIVSFFESQFLSLSPIF
jgi:hypothetical protein